jgi:hypothetical protein
LIEDVPGGVEPAPSDEQLDREHFSLYRPAGPTCPAQFSGSA